MSHDLITEKDIETAKMLRKERKLKEKIEDSFGETDNG
jgi:hypothetical protein